MDCQCLQLETSLNTTRLIWPGLSVSINTEHVSTLKDSSECDGMEALNGNLWGDGGRQLKLTKEGEGFCLSNTDLVTENLEAELGRRGSR